MSFYTKQVKFNNIANNPTILGFGCMRLPLIENSNEIDVDLTFKMIDYAYQNGVNYFDTAYPYHEGKSEIVIGKALKRYPRESFYLADKMPTWLVKSQEDVVRIFNEQLEKCQVEYFDFYLCHALNKDNFNAYRLPGVMEFLYEMKRIGKIKYLGFSFHDSPEVLKEILNTYEFDFVQLQINYLDWDFQKAKEQYELVRQKGLPIIVMEPIRGGTLADLGEKPNAIFKDYDKDSSIASWALRYVGSKPQIMTVLSGMSTLEHVIDNINTMKEFKNLSSKEEEIVALALDSFLLNNNFIPCTGCRYCMDCPMGVDIPLNFKMYNNYAISKHEKGYVNGYLKLDMKAASSCVGCSLCVKKCPQHILIPNKMKEISDFIQSVKEKY